uniref:Gustatory receptor n=1 Tax=Anopheles dirus TaxID=7168 RepID=A0A182NZ28_9DIPT
MHTRGWLLVVESIALKFFFGILPLHYNRNSARFSKGVKDLAIVVVFVILFAVVAPIICALVFCTNTDYNQINSFLMTIQLIFVYMFIILVQCLFIMKKETLHELLNDMFALKDLLEDTLDCSMTEFKLYWLFYLKIVVVDFIVQLFALLTFEDIMDYETTSIEFVTSLLFYAMMYFVTMIENLILVGLLICAVMQKMINRIVKRLAKCQVRNDKPVSFKRSPTVLQTYMIHCKNNEIVRKFMDAMNFPVLLLSGWYFFMIIYSVYFMYVSALRTFQGGLVGEEYKEFLNPCIFFTYQCLQLYLLVLIPSLYTEHAIKMMSLLNYVCVNQRHGPAQDRLLEVLMLECMQRNYSISNYGMYAMNRALLFGMIATMTSYLIILIQFHMQEYE